MDKARIKHKRPTAVNILLLRTTFGIHDFFFALDVS